MNFLLDTHILVWWYLDQPQLPQKYARLLDEAEKVGEELSFSIISLWEIAKLVSLGKLAVSVSLDQWFQELEEDKGLRVLPLNPRIVLESNHLGPHFPKDPSDQLIATTARHHGLRLMTVDQAIIKSGVVAVA